VPARDSSGRFSSGGGSLGSAQGNIVLNYDGSSVAKAQSDVQKLGQTTHSASRDMSKAGTVMAGAGAIIAGGFLLAVKSATTFQKQLSSIQAVSGATADQMAQVSAKALQLGKDTKFSAGEGAQAIEELVKAGISLPDVMNGAADATVSLAAAGEIALPQAATIASNAMNQFQLSASALPHVADVLAGAANASAISVQDMGESLSYVGPVARAVGVKIDDVSTAIAILGNNGIVGSSAGTALRSVLSNLVPTTKIATKQFKDLGLITKDNTNLFVDAQGHIKPLDQVVQILNDHTSKLNDTQKNTFAKRSFGLETLSTVAILANQTADSYDAMTASIGKVSAADVAATRMDNLSGSIEQLKGSFETLMIVVGTPFLHMVTVVVDGINKMLGIFLQLPGPIRNLVTVFGGLSGALLLVSGGLLLVIPKILEMKRTFDLLAETATFQRIAANISLLTSAIGGPWVLAIGAAVAVLGSLLLMNKKSKPPIDDLTEAIKADSGALGENTKQQVANRLQKQGVLDLADKLHISLSDLTDATLGNSDAQKRLNDEIAAAKGPLLAHISDIDSRINTGTGLDSQLVSERDGFQSQVDALDKLSGQYQSNSKDVISAKAANEQNTRAMQATTAASSAQSSVLDTQLNRALGRAASSAAAATGTTVNLKDGVAAVGDAAKGAGDDITKLKNSIQTLLDVAFGAPRALDAFQSKLNGLKQAVKENGTALQGTSDKAIANRAAFYDAASAIADFADKARAGGASPESIAAQVQNLTNKLYATAGSAGYSKTQVQNLTGALLDLPGEINPKIVLDAAEAQAKAAQLKALLNSFHDITANINIRAHTSNLRELEQQAGVPQAAAGGILNRATHVIAGEAGPEAIVPLPDLAAGFLRVFQAGQMTLAGAGAGVGGSSSGSRGGSQVTGHRIVSGELSISKSGHAFIRGVAEDVYDGNQQFAGAYGRMG
jgi:TP901 family phage tail tape measure protein